jgi:hypothetical protein
VCSDFSSSFFSTACLVVGIWGFKASEEFLLHVVRATLSAKPPPYETILELDRKVHSFATPPKTENAGPVEERTALSMQIFVRSHYQALSKQFFFAILSMSFSFMTCSTNVPASRLLYSGNDGISFKSIAQSA